MAAAATGKGDVSKGDVSKGDVSKAPPAHTKGEIQRYIDLGLGRGVDGTDPTPWLNKTSFQVRKVRYGNIVGTDEGGALQSYQREVSSVQSQQTRVKSSITTPQSPVAIGADAEAFRSLQSSRCLIGRKVINRSIAFCDDFDDVHLGQSPVTDDHRKLQTFEERLAEWILEKMKLSQQYQSEELTGSEVSSSDSAPLQNLAQVIQRNDPAQMQFIAEMCEKFIEHFRVTHYVCCLQLGAAEYNVMTQEDYELSMSTSTNAGVKGIAGASAEVEVNNKQKLKSSECKSIGVINEANKVSRGSEEEVVVDVHIRPITTLIKNTFLNACVQNALKDYVEKKRDKSSGPFLMYCGVGRSIQYLQVNPVSYAVLATSDFDQASEFFIVPTDDKCGTNEFYIVFYEKEEATTVIDKVGRRYSVLAETCSSIQHDSGVALYLDCPVSWWGDNPGPLHVRDTVSQKTSRFALKSRIVSRKGQLKSAAIDSWVRGHDMFYVISSSKGFFHSESFLAVKKISNGDDADQAYATACLIDTCYHDNNNFYMLFRLLPRQEEENSSEVKNSPLEHNNHLEHNNI